MLTRSKLSLALWLAAAACGEVKPNGDGAFSVSAPAAIVGGRVDSELAIEVQLERRDGFDGEVTIALDRLPGGVTADPVTIAGDQDSVTVTVDIAGSADPGARAEVELTGTSGDAVQTASFDLVILGLVGELDPSFGDEGVAAAPAIGPDTMRAASLVQLADGSLVVGGTSGQLMAVVKFTADGDVDTSFGTDGVFSTNFTDLSLEMKDGGHLAVQSDGNIVVAGTGDADPVVDMDDFDVVVVRITPFGDLDTTFEGGGVVVHRFGSDSVSATTISVFEGDVLYLGGRLHLTSALDAVVVRLTRDGLIDNDFAVGGTFSHNMEVNDIVGHIFELASGNLFVTGTSNAGGLDLSPTPFMIQLSPGGDFVDSFGVAGVSHLGLTAAVFSTAVETATGFLLGGAKGGGFNSQSAVWSVTAAGDLDPAFAGGAGEVVVMPGGSDASGFDALFVDDTGMFAVGGSTFDEFTSTSAMTSRFDLAGELDTSIGDDGIALTSVSGGGFPVDAILQDNIRFVTTNNSNDDSGFFLLRLFL